MKFLITCLLKEKGFRGKVVIWIPQKKKKTHRVLSGRWAVNPSAVFLRPLPVPSCIIIQRRMREKERLP